jgi:coenzyme Q-binding protein COQ10
MPAHSEIRHSPYTPQQLFAMVLDIERYPEFLPWCRAARVTERHDDYFVGELIISFSHLTERYSSKIIPLAPTDSTEGTIEVALVNGPFKHLFNHWRFVPNPTGGTDIHFAVEFQFKSKLLDTLIGGVFGRAVEKMGAAFITRADALYGSKTV